MRNLKNPRNWPPSNAQFSYVLIEFPSRMNVSMRLFTLTRSFASSDRILSKSVTNGPKNKSSLYPLTISSLSKSKKLNRAEVIKFDLATCGRRNRASSSSCVFPSFILNLNIPLFSDSSSHLAWRLLSFCFVKKCCRTWLSVKKRNSKPIR